MESPLGFLRVALVVPKFGFTAVRRNQLKRRLRELTRQHLLTRSSSCDLLLRARKDAYDASFEHLREDVGRIAAELS